MTGTMLEIALLYRNSVIDIDAFYRESPGRGG